MNRTPSAWKGWLAALAVAARVHSASALEPEDARDRGRAAADRLGNALIAELSAALESGGPVEALQVCSQRAPAIGDSLSDALGVGVGRVSDRTRNSANAPDSLERAVLRRFAAAETDRDTLIAVPDRAEYLYMRPIRIAKATCLRCHGDPEEMAPDLKAALADLYPEDRATGYAFRDFRGAFTVRIPDSTATKP